MGRTPSPSLFKRRHLALRLLELLAQSPALLLRSLGRCASARIVLREAAVLLRHPVLRKVATAKWRWDSYGQPFTLPRVPSYYCRKFWNSRIPLIGISKVA